MPEINITMHITSRQNPKVRQIRGLQRRKNRQQDNLYLVEGIYHVGEALAAQTPVESLWYAPDLLTSSFAHELIDRYQDTIPCYSTTVDVFQSMASKDNPQGILAVVRGHLTSLETLNPEAIRRGVALVAPQDPGNVGTILRTINAAGADALFLLESSVDVYHPTCVRASMGALFWHSVITASFDAFIDRAQAGNYHIVGTSVRGTEDYRQVTQYPVPVILLMGSEREGLSETQFQACNQLIRLPMHGRVTSLNLAVATGILLYDLLQKSV